MQFGALLHVSRPNLETSLAWTSRARFILQTSYMPAGLIILPGAQQPKWQAAEDFWANADRRGHGTGTVYNINVLQIERLDDKRPRSLDPHGGLGLRSS
jgi:hypothetical protein